MRPFSPGMNCSSPSLPANPTALSQRDSFGVRCREKRSRSLGRTAWSLTGVSPPSSFNVAKTLSMRGPDPVLEALLIRVLVEVPQMTRGHGGRPVHSLYRQQEPFVLESKVVACHEDG